MNRLLAHLIVVAFVLLVVAVSRVDATDCRPEPASIWAPAGMVCPPVYGDGIASTWHGPGAARNDCTYPFTSCTSIVVSAGSRSITVTPLTWCHCWTGVTGPNGETARIVDLDPSQVAALGLDPSAGLWPVSVYPLLPDTAIGDDR